jgi:dephospho-CoA kinase
VLKIGLTGGIGSGKSAVAAWLERLGAVVINSDVLAREVVAPGTDGLAAVVAAFGPGVLDPGGALDRPALGARVVDDEAARAELERIIHPRVRARVAELTAAAPPDAIVVNEVPLLIEAGLAPTYQLVVVVSAPEALRVERLASTRGMAAAKARAWIAAQATDAQRRDAADALLVNDGSLADLHAAVDALWRDRLVPYEANLRAGRPAARRREAIPVAADPTWPAQAGRWIARLAAVAGDRLLRIDHIGPTAVPGLPANDLIDIQAVVADLDAAAAVAEAAPAAGLVRAPGRRYALDRRGGEHEELVVAGADPARPVDVKLRPGGGPVWRDALLLRDWLRADPAARARYATDREPTVDRADAWAAATRWSP